MCATGEHGLYNGVAAEAGDAVDDFADVERRIDGSVKQRYSGWYGAVEFEDIVVDSGKCAAYRLRPETGGVGQHAYFHVGEIAVAQGYGVVDHAFELGVQCGLAVAREGDYVERSAFGFHCSELLFEHGGDLRAGRKPCGAVALGVVSGLAIDAVERAYFAVVGHEVYAQRRTQTPRVDWAEDGGMEKDSLHRLCYFTCEEPGYLAYADA